MTEHEEILKEPAAAKLAGLEANTFRKYRQLEIGPPYFRISRRCVRYRRADVLAWLESRRVEPGGNGRNARRRA
jgi:predicted DNA-binding transcriptional regulator AlpA